MHPHDLDPLDSRSQPHNGRAGKSDNGHHDAAARSEQIIRWLPLIAANDVLDHPNELPPAA